MDLSLITVSDFKDMFFRDFPYLPEYSSSKYYKVGAIVYYSTNETFYECILVSTNHVPTDTTYWKLAIGESEEDYILDADITKSFRESKQMFNQSLFTNDDNIELGYLYLSAHFLAYDLRTSKQGVNSTGSFNVNKRKVGNVEESYYIPEKLVDNPIYSFYTKTGYGMKYLNMVMPKLTGHMGLLAGTSTPDWNTTDNNELYYG